MIHPRRSKCPPARGERGDSRNSLRLDDPLRPCLLFGAISYWISELEVPFQRISLYIRKPRPIGMITTDTET